MASSRLDLFCREFSAPAEGGNQLNPGNSDGVGVSMGRRGSGSWFDVDGSHSGGLGGCRSRPLDIVPLLSLSSVFMTAVDCCRYLAKVRPRKPTCLTFSVQKTFVS